MPKAKYDTFRGLLRGAICSRSQAQFALESGISVEHLNRMLNRPEIYRPSDKTLMKVASVAMNGITFRMLKESLDKDAPKRDTQLPKVKLPDFETRARNTFQALSGILKAHGDASWRSENPSALMETLMDMLKEKRMENPALLDVCYELWYTRDYCGTRYAYPKYTTVSLTVADYGKSYESRLIIYHSREDSSPWTACVSMSMEAIFDLYGIPGCMIENGTEDGDIPGEALEKAMENPFYFRVEENARFLEIQSAKSLLDSLFGNKEKYAAPVEGFGFYLGSVPENFKSFVENHLENILTALEQGCEVNRETAREAIMEALNGNSPDAGQKLAETINSLETEPIQEDPPIWIHCIAHTMEAETGFPFFPMDNAYYLGKPEFKGKELDETPCIILEEADIERSRIGRKTLINTTYLYAKELGLETFGDLFYHTVRERKVPNRTYKVSCGKKPEKQEPLVLKEEQPFEKGKNQPDKTGMHTVWLKDGRELKLLWVKDPGIWIGHHKDWTRMVRGWNPDGAEIREGE